MKTTDIGERIEVVQLLRQIADEMESEEWDIEYSRRELVDYQNHTVDDCHRTFEWVLRLRSRGARDDG